MEDKIIERVESSSIGAKDKAIKMLTIVLGRKKNDKDVLRAIMFVADPQNEGARQIFREFTGIRLPRTIKISENLIREYMGLDKITKPYLTDGEVKKILTENVGKCVFIDTTKRDWKKGWKSRMCNYGLYKIDEIKTNYAYFFGRNQVFAVSFSQIRDIVIDGKSILGDAHNENLFKECEK